MDEGIALTRRDWTLTQTQQDKGVAPTQQDGGVGLLGQNP